MKNINRSGLIIFLVIAFLFTTCLISADIYARVWIKQEVNLGEPGDLPVISPISKTSNSPGTSVTASSTPNNPTEVERISVWELYSKILFGQFLGFIF